MFAVSSALSFLWRNYVISTKVSLKYDKKCITDNLWAKKVLNVVSPIPKEIYALKMP